MSDEKNEQQARLAEIEQDARAYLIGIADAVPLATVDAWLKEIGFGSFTQTRNGQTLVREIMRRAMHQVAPFFADVRMNRETAEKERDELRGRMDRLPDTVRFYEQELDVDELLAEVEKAWKEDRPCKGGEPYMVSRLAHIIRVYRGQPKDDGSAPQGAERIGVSPGRQSIAQPTQKLQDLRVGQMFRLDTGQYGIKCENDRVVFAVQDEVAKSYWHHGRVMSVPPEIPVHETNSRRFDTNQIIDEVHRLLTHAGVGLAANSLHTHDEQAKRPLVDRIAQLVRQWNEMADERSFVFKLLVKAGIYETHHKVPPNRADNTATRLAMLFNEIQEALDNAGATDVSQLDTFANRIRALSREIDKRDAALTAFWQDIRSIVGLVDVTDADREAVTEEDAANGPDAREYYAERKALLRVAKEQHEELKDVRMTLGCGSNPRNAKDAAFEAKVGWDQLDGIREILRNFNIKIDNGVCNTVKRTIEQGLHHKSVRDQFELELSEIRDVLSKESYHVDTHVELMDAIRSLVDAEPETAQDEPAETNIWPRFSSFDTRVSMPLLAKLAEMLGQPHEDAPPDFGVRQSRIVRLARAVQALATSHGISSTSAEIVDQGSFE